MTCPLRQTGKEAKHPLLHQNLAAEINPGDQAMPIEWFLKAHTDLGQLERDSKRQYKVKLVLCQHDQAIQRRLGFQPGANAGSSPEDAQARGSLQTVNPKADTPATGSVKAPLSFSPCMLRRSTAERSRSALRYR